MRSRLALLMGLWLTCASLCAEAAASRGANYFALDAGLFSNNVVGKAQALEEDQSQVSHYSIYARLRRGFHLGKNFHFEPALSTLVPWYTGVDGNTKQFTFHTDLPIAIPVFSFLRLRLGPGIEWQWIVTQGETITLNNGVSTSEFYIPGGNRLILLMTVQAGLEIRFSQRVCLNGDVTVLSVASRERRSYQVSLGLGVYL